MLDVHSGHEFAILKLDHAADRKGGFRNVCPLRDASGKFDAATRVNVNL